MALLSEIVENVRTKLYIRSKTDDTIYQADVLAAIKNAVTIFSTDRPRENVLEYVGADESNYPLPNDWDSYSRVDSIKFRPYGEIYCKGSYDVDDLDDFTALVSNVSNNATSVTCVNAGSAAFFGKGDVVTIVNDDENTVQNWVAEDGDGTSGVIALKNATTAAYASTPQIKKLPKLMFVDVYGTVRTVASDEIFRLCYTNVHVVDDFTNTIKIRDQEAFEHLSAALAAQIISAKYANTQKPNIDAIDFGSKRTEWAAVHDAEMQEYKDHLKKPWRGV